MTWLFALCARRFVVGTLTVAVVAGLAGCAGDLDPSLLPNGNPYHVLGPQSLTLGPNQTFGPVTLRQLLAAWVVHDLGHVAQVTRVMAKQYRESVGPWVPFMPVLMDRVPS